MKKSILLTVCTLFLMSAFGLNARVVKSRSFGEKTKTPTLWIVRTGIGIDNAAGAGTKLFKDYAAEDDVKASFSPNCGYELSVSFNKAIKNSGLYWGMELGLGTRGSKLSTDTEDYYEDWDYREDMRSSVMAYNVKYSPFTIGYKYGLNDDISIDAHLGIYASYDFAVSTKIKWIIGSSDDLETIEEEDVYDDYYKGSYQRFDAGLQIGIGFWYKHFNFDITYQRGFVPMYDGDKVWDIYEGENSNTYSSNLMLRVGYAF